MSKLAVVAALTIAFVTPSIAGEIESDCGDLYPHFRQDLVEWARSNPEVESIAVDCSEGLLQMAAVTSESVELDYTPSTSVLADAHPFFGLAGYYNSVRAAEFESEDGSTWQGWKGRFAAAMVLAEEGHIVVAEDTVRLLPRGDGQVLLQIGLVDQLGQGSYPGAQSTDLRYTHLWGWLRALCVLLEKILVSLHSMLGLSWGWSITLLCVLVKVALIPVTRFVAAQQSKVGEVQSALEKPLAEIKANYDGQEAHERIMAAHKDLGVSPFYTLRPMLGMFIQVPILVAVFNMLGELPALSGQSFWWITDLAYPDAIWQFISATSGIPLFGNSLNLLPIVMTVITIASAILYQDVVAPASETRKQKRNLYLMAGGFFILFYPFPASMVLYWATANVLQVVQQLVLRK